MPWKIEAIKNWSEFEELSHMLRAGAYSQYIFRGQVDASWSLCPALLRRLRPQSRVNPQSALDIEWAGFELFCEEAHSYVHPNMFRLLEDKADILMWWAIMQHHGAPTRLLDWTNSPYIALYFACNERFDNCGAVWSVNVDGLHGAMQEMDTNGFNQLYHDIMEKPLKNPRVTKCFLTPQAPKILLKVDHTHKTDRMAAQQGVFTFAAQVLADHTGLIEELFTESNEPPPFSPVKIVIPGDLKLEFLERLQAMGITAKTLFPGIDGLARSIGEGIDLGLARGREA